MPQDKEYMRLTGPERSSSLSSPGKTVLFILGDTKALQGQKGPEGSDEYTLGSLHCVIFAEKVQME